MNMSNATTNSHNFTDVVPTLEELNAYEKQGLTPTLVLLSIVCVTGIVGNGIVCHVYRTRYTLSNSQCFILWLSAMDLVSCFFMIPFEISILIDQYTFKYAWLCKISRTLNTFMTISAAFLLSFIAIDRHRKVCHPFGWQMSSKVAKKLCVLSVFLAVLVSWPAVIIYGKKTFEIPKYNLVGTECSTDDAMATTVFPFIYSALFGVMFSTEIIVICTLYCLIVREVRTHVNKMPEEKASKSSSVVNMNAIMLKQDNRDAVTSLNRCNTLNGAGNNSTTESGERSHVSNSSVERVCESYPSVDNSDKESSFNDRDNRLSKYWSDTDDDNDFRNGDIRSEQNKENIDDVHKAYNKGFENGDIKPVKPIEKYQSVQSKSIDQQEMNTDCSVFSRITSMCSRLFVAMSRITSASSLNTDTQSFHTLGKKQYLKQARARKMAFLMFLISLASIVSHMPHLSLMLFRVVKEDFLDNLDREGRSFYRFFLRSYFLSCAINPVIYGVFDTSFRDAVKGLFSKCCNK